MVATGLGVSFGDLRGVVKNAGPSSPRSTGELRSGPHSGRSPFISVPDRSYGVCRIFSGCRVPRGRVRSATNGDGQRRCPRFCWTNGLTVILVILAASSAILAPILLSFLLPLMARGANLKIDMFKIVTTLLMTQILPLGIGMLGRSGLLKYAEKLQRPATLLSAILSLVVFALIISLQYRTLAEIRLVGFDRDA